ncbi:Coenzyme PQQ synthesis protein B [Chondromyces apiculatus DSM 436]|uniref:Coenzyme PQQ synthesis protein B n=1 Tax=Chondromyces apiculatus DSM 436 TaxID=1192034 RepID=A0A017TA48_9BACT|nr:Coenzyme PQQ synthesis protein B [Chondromyces apiculatus DSM 436]
MPQWNCACANCTAARRGGGRVLPRTQDGLALGVGEGDEGDWFLVNASPDVGRQIEATPALWPRLREGSAGHTGREGHMSTVRSERASPIRGVVLTNGDLDHTLGLFSLRENTPLVLYATEAVRRGLVEGNTLFRTLQRFPEQTTWRTLALGQPVDLTDAAGAPTGVTVTARPLPGKVPKHLEGVAPSSPEDNVGLWVRDARSGRLVVIATAAASLGDWVAEVDGADALLFDGTFWSSDELPRLGLGTARAEDMAHLPVGGEDGSLARLAGVRVGRRIYTHINNSNPMLVEGSAERRAVNAAGWEVAEDGLELQV